MRSDHWRRQTCWDPPTWCHYGRWNTVVGTQDPGHWCPSLVSLPCNVGFCEFDEVLSNLSCWLLIWNHAAGGWGADQAQLGVPILWKARGTECVDGSFIHPQPLGTVLGGLPGRPLQQLFWRIEPTDIKVDTNTTNLIASHSSVIDFLLLSRSVAKVKSFFQFLKDSSEPEKSRAAHSPTSSSPYWAGFSFESGKQEGFLSEILSVSLWALLRYWLRFRKNCLILWAVSTFLKFRHLSDPGLRSLLKSGWFISLRSCFASCSGQQHRENTEASGSEAHIFNLSKISLKRPQNIKSQSAHMMSECLLFLSPGDIFLASRSDLLGVSNCSKGPAVWIWLAYRKNKKPYLPASGNNLKLPS